MAGFLAEAIELLLRWLHVVAAIAWIGESFYFVMLDRSLKPPQPEVDGVAGESWSVHGGGFYRKQKFLVAPATMPEELRWSKWKSYTTWLSGFALFGLLYLASPAIYLIDPAIAELTRTQAIVIALALPVLAWLVYDGLCRVIGFRDGLLGILIALLVLALCYLVTHLFAGRAAFLLVGAVLGTIMSANVLLVIIPGQKRMVAALAAGEMPDPLPGRRGKQRSVHNTYFTLPVVFTMLSNHYATAFAHPQSWLVLALFLAAGALIRQFFVLWHSGGRAWGLLAAGAALLLAVFAWLAPTSPAQPTMATAEPTATEASVTASVADEVTSSQVMAILNQRCNGCHSAQPKLMPSAPKGMMFETLAQVESQAVLIHKQTVLLKLMPPGNLTAISDGERELIGRWFVARPSAPDPPPRSN